MNAADTEGKKTSKMSSALAIQYYIPFKEDEIEKSLK